MIMINIQTKTYPGERPHCNHDRHSKLEGFPPSLAHPNKHSNHQPSPSFWNIFDDKVKSRRLKNYRGGLRHAYICMFGSEMKEPLLLLVMSTSSICIGHCACALTLTRTILSSLCSPFSVLTSLIE